MPELEQNAGPLIGKLVLEQSNLEKRILKLRDKISMRARVFAQIGRLLIFQPERLVFDGQTVDEKFAGEPAIDRQATEVDSLIADLRAAIVRKDKCVLELAELGIDPEEIERENNLRASRAIFHPANVRYGPEQSEPKRRDVGFTKPKKKAGRDYE